MAGFVAQQVSAGRCLVFTAAEKARGPGRSGFASRLHSSSGALANGNTKASLRRRCGAGVKNIQIIAGLAALIGATPLMRVTPLFAQEVPSAGDPRWDEQPSQQAAQSLTQSGGQRGPIWELMPPPPLPALESIEPTPLNAAQVSAGRGSSQDVRVRPGSSSSSALDSAFDHSAMSRFGSGMGAAQQAGSGLTPVSGFPTVSSTGYRSALIWELAPSPLSDIPLAAADSSPEPQVGSVPQLSRASAAPSVSSSSSAAAVEVSQVRKPLNTSGLRWELLEDVTELAAEAPDPEQLTVPVAERYTPPYLLSPYIGGGIPSAYVAGWGDFYMSGSAATPGKLRDGVVDGSFNIGMGIGDADKLVAFELDWGSGSVKNFNFNGGFSGAVGRNLIRNSNLQLSIAGGVIDAYEYGTEEDDEPASPYGVVSLTVPLRPGNPVFQQNIQISLGGGGAAFAPVDDNFEGPGAGFFASLGLEISRNAGISAAWSGRGMNANLSIVPFRDIPISINILAADLFDQTPTGTVGVLSLTWGSNFAAGVF